MCHESNQCLLFTWSLQSMLLEQECFPAFMTQQTHKHMGLPSKTFRSTSSFNQCWIFCNQLEQTLTYFWEKILNLLKNIYQWFLYWFSFTLWEDHNIYCKIKYHWKYVSEGFCKSRGWTLLKRRITDSKDWKETIKIQIFHLNLLLSFLNSNHKFTSLGKTFLNY